GGNGKVIELVWIDAMDGKEKLITFQSEDSSVWLTFPCTLIDHHLHFKTSHQKQCSWSSSNLTRSDPIRPEIPVLVPRCMIAISRNLRRRQHQTDREQNAHE